MVDSSPFPTDKPVKDQREDRDVGGKSEAFALLRRTELRPGMTIADESQPLLFP
jgi:hypothetical protein